MLDKDPTSYPFITYAWVLGLSALGGFVSFMNKLKEGKTRVFNIVEFMGEIATSAFTGVITFWLCENAQFSPLITAALVGVSGHMGSRAINLIEELLSKRFSQ